MGMEWDDFSSYQFDMAIISRGIGWEADQREEAEEKAKIKAEPPMSLDTFCRKVDSGEIPIEE